MNRADSRVNPAAGIDPMANGPANRNDFCANRGFTQQVHDLHHHGPNNPHIVPALVVTKDYNFTPLMNHNPGVSDYDTTTIDNVGMDTTKVKPIDIKGHGMSHARSMANLYNSQDQPMMLYRTHKQAIFITAPSDQSVVTSNHAIEALHIDDHENGPGGNSCYSTAGRGRISKSNNGKGRASTTSVCSGSSAFSRYFNSDASSSSTAPDSVGYSYSGSSINGNVEENQFIQNENTNHHPAIVDAGGAGPRQNGGPIELDESKLSHVWYCCSCKSAPGTHVDGPWDIALYVICLGCEHSKCEKCQSKPFWCSEESGGGIRPFVERKKVIEDKKNDSANVRNSRIWKETVPVLAQTEINAGPAHGGALPYATSYVSEGSEGGSLVQCSGDWMISGFDGPQ
ncbi:hypothetical protein DFH27DRAFT_313 [Peziza echinospora]|nr:hypothetical protein DFH27DRAFT_313 [Peziza echinospora]